MNRYRPHWLTAGVAVVAALALATACSSSSKSASAGSSASTGTSYAPATVSVALSAETPQNAPLLAAIGSGAFAKFGLTVKEDLYSNGQLAFAAFSGGTDQFCICSTQEMLAAGEQGHDVVGIFNQYIGGAAVLIGAEKYKTSKGTNLKAYSGSIWGYTSAGSTSSAYMQQAAVAAGVNWGAQQQIAVGANSAFIPALQTGRVDIESVDVVTAATAMATNVGYPVFNSNVLSSVPWGPQIGLGLVTTNAELSKNGELAQRMVDGMRTALVAIKKNLNNPSAVRAMMPQKFQAANSEAAFDEEWKLSSSSFQPTDGTYTQAAIDATVKFSISAAAITAPTGGNASLSKYFNSALAQKAVSTIPQS